MSKARLARAPAASENLIRPMTERDLAEVGEIERITGLSLWGEEAYRTELEQGNSIMLVALRPLRVEEVGKRVLGFIVARVAADEVHINNVAVREQERGRGLGSTLLAAALGAARTNQASAAVLEVRAGNRAAQALYLRHGFTVVGRRRNYYKSPPEDALVMTATL